MAQLEARPLQPTDVTRLIDHWQASPQWLPQHPGLSGISSPGAPILGVFDGERLVLTMIFRVRRRRFLTEWLTPAFMPFGGPVVSRDVHELSPAKQESFWRDALGAVAGAIPPGVHRVDCAFSPEVMDGRGLAWAGWALRPQYTYLTRWASEGTWADQFENAVRRQAAKAEREGLAARILAPGEAGGLLKLWRKNAPRQGLDPGQGAELERLGRLMNEELGFVAEVGRENEPPQAAGLFARDAHRCYYLAGASDPEALGTGAPTLLHFASLGEIDRRDWPRVYDWVGANTPAVAQFKKKFRPELAVQIGARWESPRAGLAHLISGFRRGRN
ncbi:MAG: GNAT family N-acetyltransferase [Sumerlaeia bacterium]